MDTAGCWQSGDLRSGFLCGLCHHGSLRLPLFSVREKRSKSQPEMHG